MAEPQPEAMLDANSVAAKLSRLRAAVASARGAAQLPAATGVYADDNYSEDNHAVTIAGVAGTSPIPDFGYALPGSLTAAFGDDSAATEAAETEVPQIGVADAVPEVTATKATGSAGHSAELGDDDAALLARIADRADVSEAAAVAVSGAGSVAETSDMLAGIAVSEPLAAPAEDTVAVSGADAAEVVMAGVESDDESSDMLAGIAVSEPLAGIFEDATGAVVDAPAGPVLAAAVELEVESATGVTIELADAAEPAKRVRARVVKLRRSETTEIVEIFAEQVTEADAAADPLLASIGATIGATGLSPEDEADLFSELAEAARDSEAEIRAAPGAGAEALPGEGSEASAEPVANAEADAMPERSAGAEPDTAELVGRISAAALEMPAEAGPEQGGDAAAAAVAAVGPEAGTVPAAAFEPQEDAIARLFEQTNSELEGAENRRRLDAISHLRAAVVATEADREVMARSGETDAAPTDLDGYRDDLAMVVRPRRPEAGDAPSRRPIALPERMAPLVLVSAQRIDRPAHAATEPSVIRPRRVMTSALALDLEDDSNDFAEEDQDTALEDSSNFAEFAERIGATGLSDLLEAAAAYAAYVEGRQSFSRPQIMKRIAGFAADDQFSREDGLRSFGMLLRQGKIQKVKRGQFAIAKTSRYIPEARRMAQ